MNATVSSTISQDAIDIEAHVDGQRIGYLWSIRSENRLQIADLCVQASDEKTGFIAIVRRWIRGQRRQLSFQGQGIGKTLVTHLLRAADKSDIQEIWGFVTREDLAQSPFLLDWYKRLGFAVLPNDAECGDTAVAKISRRRPRDGR